MKSVVCTILLMVGFAAFAQDNDGEKEPPGLQKAREEWFFQQRAWPLGYIPAGARAHAIQQLDRELAAQAAAAPRLLLRAGSTLPAPASGVVWQPIGPWPATTSGLEGEVSGRVSAMAVDPNNSNIVYAGAAQGGIWKTTDGGTNWVPLTDSQPSLSIGSIAIDPSNSQIIYVGTGEENFSRDSYYGAGVLKSIDGGTTWTQLGQSYFVGSSFGGFFSSTVGGAKIGSIAVSPANNQIILAGVQIFSTGSAASTSGVYRSTDGGSTWTTVQSGAPCTNVFFDPSSNGSVAYASLSSTSANTANGIYKSTDGGVTWNKLAGVTTALPQSASIGRTEIAIAPNTPSTLYASIADASGTSDNILAFLITTDGGQSWTVRSGAPDFCTPQCWYDQVLRVAPNNASVVYAGGAASNNTGTSVLWRSTDAGVTWSEISSGGGGRLHVDMHAIAFAADTSRVYVGNDGGVWSTTNITSSPVNWTNLNHTLATLQIYPGMDIFSGDPTAAIVGTQDNGTLRYGGALAWPEVTCGDASWSAIDSTGTVYYSACQHVDLRKSTGSGLVGTWSSGNITGLSPARESFLPPVVLDPNNNQVLYFGGEAVYRTSNAAANWTAISSDLTNGASTSYIDAIAVAPSDSNIVYVGTTDGKVQVSSNALGSSPSWTDRSAGLPGRAVTSVAVDRTNPQTALVGISGFTVGGQAAGHVFRTTNGGANWTDVTGTLETVNTPVNDVVIDPDFAGVFYAATDVGVFRTTDGGTNWAPLMTGLPHVAVLTLKLHRASRTLRAGTHGRSAWDLITGPVASVSTSTLSFLAQNLNTTSAGQSVNLFNTGNLPLTISGVVVTGDFAQTNNCPGSLAAGAVCTLTVSFTPTATGARSGNLTVSGNMPGGSIVTALSGAGVAPLTLSLPATSQVTAGFGNVVVLSSATIALSVTNNGGSTIHISAVGNPGGIFSQTNNCLGSLGVGSSCTVMITLTHASAGALSGSFTLSDDAGSGTQTVNISATGIDVGLALARIDRPVRAATLLVNQLSADAGTAPITAGAAMSNLPLVLVSPPLAPAEDSRADDGCDPSAQTNLGPKIKEQKRKRPRPACKTTD